MKIFENGWTLPILIVLAVIVLLYFLIRPKSEDEAQGEGAKVGVSLNTNIEQKDEVDDLEVVAAIMAALCAFTGKSPLELNVKSIRRTDSKESSWRREAISNSVRH